MRSAIVLRNQKPIGILTEENPQSYVFTYDEAWFQDAQKPPLSMTMPKNQRTFQSPFLFPFFGNLLSEGANKELQCRQLKIDENDSFGLLLATAQWDTIGAITVKPIEND
jgi:HipA-like protein